MASPYHPGESAVQARAGVLAAAARLGGMIQPAIPAHAGEFLAAQRLAVVGAADADGRVWASLLTGQPGMLRSPDPGTLHVAARPAAGDPLAAALAAGTSEVGVLLVDPATRRRLRVNGAAEPADGGGLLVRVRQAYWICPKYIQMRVADPRPGRPPAPAADGAAPRVETGLTDAQRAGIAAADTLFIATAHPGSGADASHRGGEPGFVRVERGAAGEDVLVFPDYPGNNMFNTFGNLAVSPAAGLLFVDFEAGATLQLTGTAEVLWEPEEFAVFPGALRAVRFRVAGALETAHGTRLRWRLVQRSPFNPPPPAPPRSRAAGPGEGRTPPLERTRT